MTAVTGRPSWWAWEAKAISRAWRFLASMRLALALILALAALTLVGTVVMQVPPPVRADPASYSQWLAQARQEYGPWAGPFERLGLFDVFRALYFRALVTLLAANIIVCTTRRWDPTWRAVFRSRVRMNESLFQRAPFRTSLSAPLHPAEAASRIERILRRRRYRVTLDAAGDSIAFLADRNRLSVFGTFLTHLGIVLILLGALVGRVFGFTDDTFIVAEGSTRAVAGTNLSLRLEHFADEYWVSGPPKDFRSEVTLLEDGREVRTATIRVNSPLRYHGIAFHQSFFGQVAVLKVQDRDGSVIFEGAVPLAYQTREGGRPIGGVALPGESLTAWVTGPRSGENDPLVQPGEMRLELWRRNQPVGDPVILTQGRPATVSGLTFTFVRESRFTGLKVVKDPGIKIVWIASGLLVLGMVALFYFPRRRAWGLLRASDDGTTEIKLAMPRQRGLAPGEDFRKLAKSIERALGGVRGAGAGKQEGGGTHDRC